MTLTRLLGNVLRWLVIGAAALVSVGFLVGFFARFGDGPIGPLPGGRLHKGDMTASMGANWSFVDGVSLIELQLLEPEHSRTVWVVRHGEEIFVPCGFVNVPFFKQWHEDALQDGRGVVRINGKRYPVMLARVRDPTIYSRVAQRFSRKYDTPPYDPETAWIFRVDPRRS